MRKYGKLWRLARQSQRKRQLIGMMLSVQSEFKKISSIETAQEAWTILQTTYKGTKAIKDSKLQKLTMSFKEIKMEDDESFDEFYVKLKDIVNSTFNLGETIPEPKVVSTQISA